MSPAPVGGSFTPHPRTPAGHDALALVASVADIVRKEAAEADEAGVFAAAAVERLRGAGVFAVNAPREFGGTGLTSLHDTCLVVRELARINGSIGIGASMHLALTCYFARQLAHPGTADLEHRRGWMRRIGAREMVLASAVAEPGREAWRVAAEARRSGDGWSVTGTKILVSLSPGATHLYTRVRTPGEDGYAMATAMIDVRTAGVTVHDDWSGLGLRCSGSGRVVLDDVRLPAADVRIGGSWGAPDPGDFAGRAAASIPIVAAYAGMAAAAYDVARDRFTTGAADPGSRWSAAAVRTAYAELTVAMAQVNAVLGAAAERVDEAFRSTAPRGAGDGAGRDLLADCLIAALAVERSAGAVVDRAMEICGGASYGAASELGRVYRDVKAAAFMRPYSPPERWADFLADTGAAR
ncbi:acyl-CoA dehydrogenase family protein [Actinoplanes sp. NPDC051851]|uniref:acyl-CoA dehydrogenase family protein n=1 Tax=Actinoplanes sp. NPDC051851 TaxID=3154753 RepID=UPI0034352E4A